MGPVLGRLQLSNWQGLPEQRSLICRTRISSRRGEQSSRKPQGVQSLAGAYGGDIHNRAPEGAGEQWGETEKGRPSRAAMRTRLTRSPSTEPGFPPVLTTRTYKAPGKGDNPPRSIAQVLD